MAGDSVSFNKSDIKQLEIREASVARKCFVCNTIKFSSKARWPSVIIPLLFSLFCDVTLYFSFERRALIFLPQ